MYTTTPLDQSMGETGHRPRCSLLQPRCLCHIMALKFSRSTCHQHASLGMLSDINGSLCSPNASAAYLSISHGALEDAAAIGCWTRALQRLITPCHQESC